MSSGVARVEPFAALIFNRAKSGPLEDLVAPPYDLIDAAWQDRLYARSAYNVVRLELNRDPDPYASAAATFEQWVSRGILERIAPAIFLYTQKFKLSGKEFVRTGLVARIRLEEFAPGRILPHERTFPKAKEDRLRLLTALRANTSSIFGLYPSGNRSLESLIVAVSRRPAMLEVVDELGILNEVRRIDAPNEVATIQHALDSARLLIADGHHRYETALEYRRRMNARDPSHGDSRPDDYVMMTLVAFNDPGLVILPTHRVVQSLSRDQVAAFKTRIGEKFIVDEFRDASEMLTRLKENGRGYIGIAVKDCAPIMVHLRRPDDIAQALPDARDEVRNLDVSVLHALIFEEILGIDSEMVRGGANLSYTIDASRALDEVATGTADGAFFLNPPTVYDVEQVSDAGATMPEKSTYFFPKLLTGLLMNPLA